MMQILLPEESVQKLIKALERAGNRESGGILMGEHVSDRVYRVKDLTIQAQGGTVVSFLRIPMAILRPLQNFFQKTGYDFTRFNYLGEWHSHPTFAPEPSNTDCRTMWEIVKDPRVGANFAVLMIVRLGTRQQLEGTVTVFLPDYQMFQGTLIQEKSQP